MDSTSATDPGDLPPRRRHWRAAYKVNFFTWILLSSNMPRPSDPAISICSIWQFRNWLALSGFDNAIDAMPTSARLASITFQPVLSSATALPALTCTAGLDTRDCTEAMHERSPAIRSAQM